MKFFFILSLFIFFFQDANAKNYFLSINGSDGNIGSVSSPFRSFDRALNVAVHGDTIFVMPGIYTNATYGTFNIWKSEQAVRINNKNSTSTNYLVIKPHIPGTVKFRSDGNFIFQIRNSSYIRVEGFEFEGERDNISLSVALQYQFTYKDANGIILERVAPGTPASKVATMTFPILTEITRPSLFNADAFITQNSHHIDVINNTISKSTSAGIRIQASDYVNVIGNTISECNQRTSVGTPALVLSLINSIDNNENVKIVIARNKVYNNFNKIYSWSGSKSFITPLIDEGKGISLEHCITRVSPEEPSWHHGRVRIENNICYGNGFSGINTNEAERVDIINNTCYQNIASGRGQNTGISVNEAIDVNVYNNISYSINTFGGHAYSFRKSTMVNFSNNLAFGTIDADVDAIDVNTIFSNPLFKDTIQFNLLSNSPAINASFNPIAPSIDYYGNFRDNKKDIGAVEYIACIASSGTDTKTTCGQLTWIDGKTYTTSNNTAAYTIKGGAKNGCDSIVTLNLKVLNPAQSTDTRTSCGPITWIDGKTYTTSNNTAAYTIKGGAKNGCDSTVTLNLKVLNPGQSTDTRTSCSPITWIDGKTYTASNNTATHTIKGGAKNGCDSIVILNLTVNTVDTTITQSINILISNAVGATYQWMDCDLRASISGETKQNFKPATTGNYAVIVTDKGCTDTSACRLVTLTSALEPTFTSSVKLFPNPTDGQVKILLANTEKLINVRLYSLVGQILHQSTEFNTSEIILNIDNASGMYIAEITNFNGEKARIQILKTD